MISVNHRSPMGVCPGFHTISGRRGEQGAVTPMMIGLMVLGLSIAISVVGLNQAQNVYTRRDGRYIAAQNLAEAGVDRVVWRLQHAPNWRTIADEQTVTLGDGQYTVTALKETNGLVTGARVQGWVPAVNAPGAVHSEVYVDITPIASSPFQYAVLGNDSVTVHDIVNSYNSGNAACTSAAVVTQLSHGDIATNSTNNNAIQVNGAGQVNGQAFYPSNAGGGTFQGTNPTGGKGPNPSNTMFQPIPTIPASAIYIPGYCGGSIYDVNGNLVPQPLAPGTYVFTDHVTVVGTDQIEVSGSGPTTIYFQMDGDIGGNGILNNCFKPSNLVIYGGPGVSAIDLHSNTDFYGAIYAPNANIRQGAGAATGNVYGSLVGKTVMVDGSSVANQSAHAKTKGGHKDGNKTFGSSIAINYDEALKTVGSSGYKIASWTIVK